VTVDDTATAVSLERRRATAALWRAGWQLAAVSTTALILTVLYVVRPGLWYVDDKRNQYLPVLRDIGRRLRAGDFPAVDPDLGPGGNFTLDTQYGLYDPLHLATGYLVSFVDDLPLAAFLIGAGYLLVMAWGTCALLQRLEVGGPLAVVGAVAAATSGWVLFKLAANWWPGVVGMAFLPWLWWAWAGRLAGRRLVLLAVFTYLVVASGWPATWLVLMALALGLLVEAVVGRPGGGRVLVWLGPLAARAAAMAAGAVVGLAVHVLPIMRAVDYTDRSQGLANDNRHIVNLADVLAFSAPFLRGDIRGYFDITTVQLPIFFCGWFLLAMAWLTRWDAGTIRRRGLPTALTGVLVMLLLTQAPSEMGPIRAHFRQLAGVHFFAVVLGVVAFARSGPVWTRGRVWGIAFSVVATAFLAWARTPTLSEPLTGMALVAIAMVAVLATLRLLGVHPAGLVALLGTVGLLVYAAVTTPYFPDQASVPTSVVRGPMTITSSDRPAVVLAGQGDTARNNRWARQGLGRGFSNLTADNRFAHGYSSVSQRYYRDLLGVFSPHGESRRAGIRRLFTREPTTSELWVDLLGYRSAVVSEDRAVMFERFSRSHGWSRVATTADLVKFRRSTDPAVAGRVTAAPSDVDVAAVTLEGERQVYDVSAPEGGVLVLRDIYWPGYVATLDGDDLQVSPLAGVLVSVELPADAEGRLVVEFQPHPAAGLSLAGAVALLLLTAGGALCLLVRRGARNGAGDSTVRSHAK
jgi:hypothetical protein